MTISFYAQVFDETDGNWVIPSAVQISGLDGIVQANPTYYARLDLTLSKTNVDDALSRIGLEPGMSDAPVKVARSRSYPQYTSCIHKLNRVDSGPAGYMGVILSRLSDFPHAAESDGATHIGGS